MAFSYGLNSSDNTIKLISQVRMQLGDHVEDCGVLPDNGNLQDDEIQYFLDATTNDVAQAVSQIAELLSRRWATVADVQVGPRRESLSQVSKKWADLASTGGEQYDSFTTEVDRVDGYSVAADAA